MSGGRWHGHSVSLMSVSPWAVTQVHFIWFLALSCVPESRVCPLDKGDVTILFKVSTIYIIFREKLNLGAIQNTWSVWESQQILWLLFHRTMLIDDSLVFSCSYPVVSNRPSLNSYKLPRAEDSLTEYIQKSLSEFNKLSLWVQNV